MHSSRAGVVRSRWIVVAVLCLALAACRWTGGGSASGGSPADEAASADGTAAIGAAEAGSAPVAAAGSGTTPGSVPGAASDPASTGTGPSTTVGPVVPTLAPGATPAPAAVAPAGTATTAPSATPAPTTAPGPAPTAPRPAPAPATPGVTAQAGDPNDAFNGGGPVNCPLFPSDNWWNRDIRALPVHPQSAAWVGSLGSGNLHPDFGTIWDGKAIGIPYVVVDGSQPRVPVSFDYAGESDPGPYPIPANAPLEDGADHHLIVVDDTNCKLYELFDATRQNGGASWHAGSGAVFDLRSNALRPASWTSADAAGLPIFAGLATYDEVVVQGRIDHALRFTSARTQRAYIRPATHFASSITDPGIPPMGARFRLKADYDCSAYSAEIQVVCAALKTYGMFLADNGANWMVSGAPDPRWNDRALADLKKIPGSAFEVVDTGEPITR